MWHASFVCVTMLTQDNYTGQLLACFKKRPAAKELDNNNWIWICAARHLSARDELLEYIKLWRLLPNVSLNAAATTRLGGVEMDG
jgi:hypothetical protein